MLENITRRQVKRKIYAKPFYYDPITQMTWNTKNEVPKDKKHRVLYWESILEFNTWKLLNKHAGEAIITRQYEIPLLPPTQQFNAWTWAVDFAVFKGDRQLLIECKGKWIQQIKTDFHHLLHLLYYKQPTLFNSLIVVGSDKEGEWFIPGCKIQVVPYTRLERILKLM